MSESVSGPAAGAASEPSVPLLASDFRRLALACAAGVVIAAVVLGIIVLTGGTADSTLIVVGLLSFSAGSSLVYLVHTVVLFGRADGPTLARWIAASTPRGRFGAVEASLSGTGPTIAVQWSVIAIAAVLVFTIWPGLLDRPVTVWLSILVVAASWGVTIVAYAVHYARLDAAAHCLQYPDGNPRVFTDYVYLSVQVQTTFSTSDVSLASTAARSVVTGHTLVSFAFATVIIAMLITVLFLGAST
ncbi:DUF1345 domain-containing protein [Microbacterium sp. BWT-B31]|uniref:DUF1345 domain-containing protein n=1 Tax=Microbacterium sp. BWT-B31 TaxID=3232072 RepID=UPI003526D21E